MVSGRWTDYQVSFTWMDDIEALHLACAFDLKVPERRRAEVQTLIALINEQLWVGHFDLWTKDGMVMFRHALVLAGGVEASGQQCEALLGTALDSLRALFPGLPVRGLGRQAARARRSTPPCSRPRARRKPPVIPRSVMPARHAQRSRASIATDRRDGFRIARHARTMTADE